MPPCTKGRLLHINDQTYLCFNSYENVTDAFMNVTLLL